MHTKARFAAIAALALATAPAFAGNHVWTSTGPDGGQVFFMDLDPAQPDRLIAGGGNSGPFRSLDAGATWTLAERGLPPGVGQLGDVAWSSDGTRVYLMQIGRLYRSDDDGALWQRLSIAPSVGGFNDLVVKPGNKDLVALATDDGVFVSEDGGLTFDGPGTGLPVDLAADVVPIAVAFSAGAVYALLFEADPVSGAHLFKSLDLGATWTPTADTSALGVTGGELIVAASNPDVLYWHSAGNGLELIRVTNGGTSFSALPVPADAGASGTVTTQPGAPDQIWTGNGGGLYYTPALPAQDTDWTALNSGLTPNGVDPAPVWRIRIHPDNPNTPRWFAGALHGGVFRTDTAGVSWNPVNNGLRTVLIRSVAVHPTASNVVLAGQGNGPGGVSRSLFRSVDSGATWPTSNTGLNAQHLRRIAIDPTTTATVAGTVVYAAGFSDGVPARDGGVYKSTNGGLNWSAIDSGIATTGNPAAPNMGIVSGIALDPRSCASPPPVGPCTSGPLQMVYVSGVGVASAGTGSPYVSARIYKSTNAGASWTASESGLPLPTVNPSGGRNFVGSFSPLVIVPSNPSTLYLGTSMQGGGDRTTATIANGVFVSTNGGATWSHSSNGLPRYGGPGTSQWDVVSLAINPFNPLVLYASLFQQGASGTHVYKTTDGGANWFDASNGLTGQIGRALSIDPTDATGNTVYLVTEGSATEPGGFLVSRDAGATWDGLSVGLADVRGGFALAQDPGNPARFYAGGERGVFRIDLGADPDLDAVPTSVEDGAPNAGDGDADGTKDRTQTGVASLPTVGTEASYVTIDLVSGCTRINNAEARLPAYAPPDPLNAAASVAQYGLVRFELPSCAGAAVDLTFHGASFDDADWRWRSYGPTTPGDDDSLDWHDLAGAVRLDADTWRLTLTANALGSWRARPDAILAVGAPVFLPNVVFADQFEGDAP